MSLLSSPFCIIVISFFEKIALKKVIFDDLKWLSSNTFFNYHDESKVFLFNQQNKSKAFCTFNKELDKSKCFFPYGIKIFYIIICPMYIKISFCAYNSPYFNTFLL